MDSQRDIDQHLKTHEITRVTLEGFAFRYQEVVIDLRAVKDGSLEEILVFEFGINGPLVVELRGICYRVEQKLHVDGLSFLEAEDDCRSRVASVCCGVL